MTKHIARTNISHTLMIGKPGANLIGLGDRSGFGPGDGSLDESASFGRMLVITLA